MQGISGGKILSDLNLTRLSFVDPVGASLIGKGSCSDLIVLVVMST